MASNNGSKPKDKKVSATDAATDAVLESAQADAAIEAANGVETDVSENANAVEADSITASGAEKPAAEEDLTDSSKYLLRVRNLKKYFPIKKDFFGRPTAQLRAVDDVSFDLERGKTLGIVGESGCGKTTMGRTILKLHQPTDGKIYFDGVDIAPLPPSRLRPLRTKMQIIFQDP